MTMHTHVMPRAARVVPLAFAALALLGACGSDGDGTAEQPLPTAPTTSPTTAPAPEPTPISPPVTLPTTIPVPSTSAPVAPVDQRYEAITSVIETADGPRLCF